MAMKSIIGLWQKAKKAVSSSVFWPKDNIFHWTIATLLAVNVCDIVSTVVTIAMVSSAHESNPFMVDSLGNFLVWQSMKVKAVGMVGAAALGYGFYKSTGDKRTFAIPSLYLAWSAGLATLNNILIYMVNK